MLDVKDIFLIMKKKEHKHYAIAYAYDSADVRGDRITGFLGTYPNDIRKSVEYALESNPYEENLFLVGGDEEIVEGEMENSPWVILNPHVFGEIKL